MTKIISKRVLRDHLPYQQFADYLQLQAEPTGIVRQDEQLEVALISGIEFLQNKTGKIVTQNQIRFEVKGAQFVLNYGAAHSIDVVSIQDERALGTEDGLAFEVDKKLNTTSVKVLNPRSSLMIATCKIGPEIWNEIETDVRQACFGLGAYFYETRLPNGNPQHMPEGIAEIIEQHRNIKILRGVS